ncbi:NAD(P)-binding protein [Mollisia scopiformis]|uniref:NAD(P)-binding protein n=1 Tax=Mollisia scopiformis TaxID=149040 RepID=A0A194XPU0_MOLSC|nr:NAD(P)-binding protein [Mollisia scopiformis]KUJ21762.1 NAD(P)-binding protein [Mollisia scopiformis]
MPLTVLTDANVKDILQSLDREELLDLQSSMREALHEYATGTTSSGASAANQPNRTVIESSNGTTTLFMPSTSSSGIGMKVVTLAAPPASPEKDAEIDSEATTPQGALTLMDASGRPFGFLNAEEVTAFRTALASSLLINRRTKVKTLTVFGTGKQAYWHVRLALLLRGPTIKKVHFLNRDFNHRAAMCMKSFVGYDPAKKRAEGWFDTTFDLTSLKYGEIGRILKDHVRAADVIICTTPSSEPLFDHTILTNTEGRRRARLIIAIGSYKPHMIEVPPEVLTQAIKVHGPGFHFHKHAEEGGVIVVDTLACIKEAGELVQASVPPDRTVELGELVMLEQMHMPQEDDSAIDDSPEDSTNENVSPVSPDSSRSLARAFREHSIDGGPKSASVSRKSSFSRKGSFSLHSRSGSMSSLRRKKIQTEKEDQMSRWLSGGNVIYKSVGMGLMDLVVGSDVIKLAREKNIGVTVDEF